MKVAPTELRFCARRLSTDRPLIRDQLAEAVPKTNDLRSDFQLHPDWGGWVDMHSEAVIDLGSPGAMEPRYGLKVTGYNNQLKTDHAPRVCGSQDSQAGLMASDG